MRHVAAVVALSRARSGDNGRRLGDGDTISCVGEKLESG